MMIRDLYPSTIREQYACNHWTWYATNGKSADENYGIQKLQFQRLREDLDQVKKAAQDINLDDDIVDVKINIKTEVR